MKIKEIPTPPEIHQASIEWFRELLARTWLQRYISDPRSGKTFPLAPTRKLYRWFPEGRECYKQGVLGELESLLGPIVALQLVGSPKELHRKKEELIEASRETLSVPFLEAKIVTARFYAEHVLPRVHALLPQITHGSGSVLALADDQF